MGLYLNLDHDPGGFSTKPHRMHKSSLFALPRSDGLRASREGSPPRERGDRSQWGQAKNIRKNKRRVARRIASGVCSLRLMPSFPDMTDTLTCLPSMSQTHDVTTPVMKTPPPTLSVEPVSQSSQVCTFIASESVV